MSSKKNTKKKGDNRKRFFSKALFVISTVSFLVFLLTSLDLLTKNSYGSRSFLIEFFKLFQFCFLTYFVVTTLAYKNNFVAWISGTFLVFLQIIFSAYFLLAKKPLDFMFFALNKNNLVDVFLPYLWHVLVVLFLAGFIAYFFLRVSCRNFKKNLVFTLFGISLISISLFRGGVYLNETLGFFKSAFTKDAVIDLYQIHYKELVEESILDKKLLQKRIERSQGGERPNYLDNIIFLQIESLNSELMSQEITPNFYKIADKGINFPNFYANGVQTILGQENLLCSLPSSFYSNLNSTGNDKNVLCLPEAANKMGYRTAFFKTYDLNFTNTGQFMRNIGFSETHMEDIMQDKDPQYHWGYREDVFYERALSYVGENFDKKDNFLFLEVGPTNHWPFKTPSDYVDIVPHKEPKNQKERLENTMFLQDKHLGVAWQKIEETFPDKNYTVVVVGDHSWPAGKYSGNEFCGSGPFEENFKTGLTIVFGEGNLYQGEKREENFSQMDILPSFFDLWGIKISQNQFRKSLFHKDAGLTKKHKIVMVQPFSDRYLVFLDNDKEKSVYNSTKKEWKTFNLNIDSSEEDPIRKIIEKKQLLEVAKEYLPIVDSKRIIMHALGGIEGYDYTNSREAFENSLNKDRKIFEIDVNLSKDNKLVLSHAKSVSKTKNEFLQSKTKGGFTPATLEDVLVEMREREDLVLVTDIKGENYTKIADILFNQIKKEDKSVISKIIPQIYNEETFLVTKDRFGFSKMIYTLYKDNKNDEEVLSFVGKNLRHIPIVVMSKSRFREDLNWSLRRMGVKTFVHTLNKERDILKFRKKGAYGIFTDNY